MYVNTRNIHIKNSRLVSILLRSHALSSRLLLNLCRCNISEPQIHSFVLKSKSPLSPVSCPWWSPIFLTYRRLECGFSPKPLKRSTSVDRSSWPWRWRVNNFDQTKSLPQRYVHCMCGVSTQQWPSTRITLFERTWQSTWLDAVTTPLTRREWILVY